MRYEIVDKDGVRVNGRTYSDEGIANAHNGRYFNYRYVVRPVIAENAK